MYLSDKFPLSSEHSKTAQKLLGEGKKIKRMYMKSDDLSFYRPQRSWGKVMFLQVSVILLTGVVCIPACLAGLALYKQLHCWLVSVGEEAAYR